MLMQRSQYVNEAVLHPESIDNDELLASLRATLERLHPDIVIPTDDTSVLVLHQLRAQLGADAPLEQQGLFSRSLGDVRHSKTVRNRKLLAGLATRQRVHTPAQGVVHSEADALHFAAENRYPIVLKEEDSVAGFGVNICKNEGELRRAVQELAKSEGQLADGVLVQGFVEGRSAMRVVVAQAGRVLGGLSAIKLETWPRSTGPSSCVEVIDHPEMEASAASLVDALGYSGFASLDFMLDESGRAALIELNPRPTPISHLGERLGACLFRKLAAALRGEPADAGKPQGLPARVALFPQEWVRDQESAHLAAGVYHDVPWDEPDLVEAYTAFARGQMRYESYGRGFRRNGELRSRLSELERISASLERSEQP
jgi:predicted ATP-grasp superfamily ATP-dependent carboligase